MPLHSTEWYYSDSQTHQKLFQQEPEEEAAAEAAEDICHPKW